MIIQKDLTQETEDIVSSIPNKQTTVWITFGLGTPESIVVEIFQSEKESLFFVCEGIVDRLKEIVYLNRVFRILSKRISSDLLTFMVDLKVWNTFKSTVLSKTFDGNIALLNPPKNFLNLDVDCVIDYHSLFLKNNFQKSFEYLYSYHLELLQNVDLFWGLVYLRAIRNAIFSQHQQNIDVFEINMAEQKNYA